MNPAASTRVYFSHCYLEQLELCLLGIKMATEKRIKILTEAEAQELYSPPTFGINDQRFFFSLDDREYKVCKKIR